MKNEEPTPIVDAFLEEWLANRRPRGLTVEGLSRREYSPMRLAELDEAVKLARADGQPRRVLRSAEEYRRGRSSSWVWPTTLAALAASVALAFGLRHFWLPSTTTPLASVESAKAAAQPIAGEVDRPRLPKLQLPENLPALSSEQIAEGGPTGAVSEDRKGLSLKAAPFPDRDQAVERPRQSQEAALPPRLVSREIVEVIDQQLKDWWTRHQVAPAATVDREEWMQRVTRRLFNRPPSDDEKKRLGKMDGTTERLQWLETLVEQKDFARAWGSRLAAFYLDVPMERRSYTEQVRLLNAWVQRELRASNYRVDEIARELLVLDPGPLQSEEGFSPSRFWWGAWKSSGKYAAADFIDHRLLGRRGACERCHDGSKVEDADRGFYWGLASIAHGVQSITNAEPRRELVQLEYRSHPAPVFYEREDASMAAVPTALPNGRAIPKPSGSPSQIAAQSRENLQAFVDWLVASDEFAQSQAGMTWHALFGQALQTEVGFEDRELHEERKDLVRFLSQQLRAYQFDVRPLVVAILASEAFARDQIDHDGAWYAAATREDIAKYRARQRMFAVFPRSADATFRSLDKLAVWTETQAPFAGKPAGVLAQPLPPGNPGKLLANGSSSKKAGTASKSSLTESLTKLPKEQVQYLIQLQTVPPTLEQEVDRLLKSALTWPELVEHVFYMTGSVGPSRAELIDAERILAATRDRRQALLRILAARQ
jgi:hypothetical protein